MKWRSDGLEATHAPSVLIKAATVKTAMRAGMQVVAKQSGAKISTAIPGCAFGQVIGIHIVESFVRYGFLITRHHRSQSRARVIEEYFVTTADARFFLKFTEAHKMGAQPHAKKTEE